MALTSILCALAGYCVSVFRVFSYLPRIGIFHVAWRENVTGRYKRTSTRFHIYSYIFLVRRIKHLQYLKHLFGTTACFKKIMAREMILVSLVVLTLNNISTNCQWTVIQQSILIFLYSFYILTMNRNISLKPQNIRMYVYINISMFVIYGWNFTVSCISFILGCRCIYTYILTLIFD